MVDSHLWEIFAIIRRGKVCRRKFRRVNKMNKKIILIIIIIALALGFTIYQSFIKKEKPAFTLEKVSRGTILQEVSETGTVKPSEEVNLGFKNAGRIEKIYVKVGDNVELEQSLAKLDTTQLSIQLREAQATLEMNQAKLNKLLAGSSPEEIKIAETTVANAEIALENAKQNLKDITAVAEENLEAAYEDVLNILDDSYLKSYNAFNVVDSIQTTYFYRNDQEGIKVRENKDRIKNDLSQIKTYLDIAKSDSSDENIDTALSKTKIALDRISSALAIIRQLCEEPSYQNIVASSSKTSLDTQRTNINTAYTNVTDAQQTISSTKIDDEYNINTANAQVSVAEGQLQKAQDELTLKKAGPRQVDIDLYQAQVRQAQARVVLLQDQIQEATLKSPTEGQIIKTNKRVGETVQPMLGEPVISLFPVSPFQIEVDIYEEDIVKVKIGNPVDIILAAFSDEILKGKVISIDPAEKLIEGVVYYEVTIDFEERKEEIKPGMTADVVIKTASKENVLIVSEEAIQKKDGKVMVQVFKDGLIQDRVIEIGFKGSDDEVEVISGLEEGEEVIIK